MKKAVILYGPPGAGKGTQAELIANRFGLIHFDTGRLVEQLVNDPATQNDPIIRREKKNFESGNLMTPAWVLKIVKEKATAIHKSGFGIVFSGSPRTVLEARGLIPVLEKLYKKKNLKVFIIKISEKESINRNSHRIICTTCNRPLMRSKKTFTSCPFCGGKLHKRTLDKPDVIRIRFQEYINRTKPVFAEIKRRGYKIVEVNGATSPSTVFKNIQNHI